MKVTVTSPTDKAPAPLTVTTADDGCCVMTTSDSGDGILQIATISFASESDVRCWRNILNHVLKIRRLQRRSRQPGMIKAVLRPTPGNDFVPQYIHANQEKDIPQ